EGTCADDGTPTGEWRRFTADGAELPARVCASETDLHHWAALEKQLEGFAGDWPAVLGTLRALSPVCLAPAVALVSERAGRISGPAPAEVVTAILGDAADPRASLVQAVECQPGWTKVELDKLGALPGLTSLRSSVPEARAEVVAALAEAPWAEKLES